MTSATQIRTITQRHHLHLLSVDRVVGRLVVLGGLPRLDIVESLTKGNDLDSVGDESHGEGLDIERCTWDDDQSVSGIRQKSTMTTQTHDRDGQDREVSVKETVSETESSGRVGHDEGLRVCLC